MGTDILVEEHRYTVVEDTTDVLRVLLMGRAVDEFTGLGVAPQVSVRPDHFSLKALVEGWFAVSGHPERDFPRLTLSSYTLQLTVQAPGYRDAGLSVGIPAGGHFPISLPDVSLRPLPVRLEGRITKAATPHSPIPGALVFAQDPGRHALLLRMPIRKDRPAGTVVREVSLAPSAVVGPPKQLARPAARGHTTLLLNDRQGLQVGRILRTGDPILGQLVRIQSVATSPTDLTQPGEVTVTLPLSRSLPEGAPCTQLTLTPVNPPDKHLQQTAAEGEAMLLLDSDVSAAAIELTNPPGPSEYHDVGVLTDAAGFYEAAGIGGVTELRVNTRAAGFPTPPAPLILGMIYRRPVHLANWQL